MLRAQIGAAVHPTIPNERRHSSSSPAPRRIVSMSSTVLARLVHHATCCRLTASPYPMKDLEAARNGGDTRKQSKQV